VCNCTVTCTGEFGRVYKGTWEWTIDGNTVTEVVAIKTIKGMISLTELTCC